MNQLLKVSVSESNATQMMSLWAIVVLPFYHGAVCLVDGCVSVPCCCFGFFSCLFVLIYRTLLLYFVSDPIFNWAVHIFFFFFSFFLLLDSKDSSGQYKYFIDLGRYFRVL